MDENSTALRMPVAFAGHGAPLLALDTEKGAEFTRWAHGLPRRPSAVLVISAHWEDAPVTVSSVRADTPLVYDFYGFPEALYRIRHDAPPAPELAKDVMKLLEPWRPEASERGLDHGVWTVLTHFDPGAILPTLQLSMPHTASPSELVALGRLLAPLRDQDVWIVGSGNMTHNLRLLQRHGGTDAPPAWAAEFDAWASEALSAGDVDALCDAKRAPGWGLAHPTPDHYRPLLVAAGAAGADVTKVRFPIVGFEFGSLSRRSVEFG